MQIISWEEYTNLSFPIPHSSFPLAVTIGVFDGVHRGHQALIRHICDVPRSLPTVVTFRQNPVSVLRTPGVFKSGAYTSDILTLDQKLSILEGYGVQLTVLIDFSEKIGKIGGRHFIDLLLGCRPVKLIALGQNFRCGHGLDTGIEEIRYLAGDRGVEVWAQSPVMDSGLPVSSSRIRQALAEGRAAEAERLLGRSINGP